MPAGAICNFSGVSAVLNVTAEYIGELMEKYGDAVLRVAFTYLKNMADAEDAVQEVFLKIIDKPPEFDEIQNIKAWLIRVAVNVCKNKLNLYWNKNKTSIDDVAEIETFDKYNLDSDVTKAVMSLGEKYRIVIYMYYYEGYSTPEIAEITDKSETAVRSLLHRARAKLKNILKEDYDFEQAL